MPTEITMPKLSDTMTEGKLISWKKSPGSPVERGEIIAEVETDKANMELEAFSSGILLETRAKEGDVIQVGQVIAVIGEEGEQAPAPPERKPEPESAPEPAAKPEKVPEEGTAEGRREEVELRKDEGLQELGEGVTAAAKPAPEGQEAPVSSPAEAPQPAAEKQPAPAESPARPAPREEGELIHTSPLVRRLARERGIDLKQVPGSGPDGRILAEDLEKVTEQPRPRRTAERKPGRTELSKMRAAIAKRVSATWQQVPHFSVTAEVDMAYAEAAYRDLKGGGKRLSLNDLIVKACAVALAAHPAVNASFAADGITIHDGVHVGVAVAVEEGLLIPVVRDADRLSLLEIAARSAELVEKCRSGKISEGDLSGGTFTVSNLGMFGIDEFAAIINAPEAAILAVGAVAERPVVRNGLVVPGRTMRITLSCDHRALNGATAAEFLADLKHLLESPALLVAS